MRNIVSAHNFNTNNDVGFVFDIGTDEKAIPSLTINNSDFQDTVIAQNRAIADLDLGDPLILFDYQKQDQLVYIQHNQPFIMLANDSFALLKNDDDQFIMNDEPNDQQSMIKNVAGQYEFTILAGSINIKEDKDAFYNTHTLNGAVTIFTENSTNRLTQFNAITRSR